MIQELQKTKRRNLSIDISIEIRHAFYEFIKKNPTWYDNVKWEEPGSTYRFGLQANRAAERIKKILEDAGYEGFK